MNRAPWALGFLVGLAGLAGCGDAGDGGAGGGGSAPTAKEAAIRGWVTDLHQAGLSGVSVTSALGSTTTDVDGRFELTGSDLGPVVVTFAKDGYVTRADTSELVANQVTARHAVLMPETAAIQVDATAGASVSGPRGVELTIPPGSLVDGSGTPAVGMVDVHLTPFDPSLPEEAAAIGGGLSGQTKSGAPVLLESFGMMDVTVRQGGVALQIADGQELDVAIAVPAAVASPAAETGLWSYDAQNARWVEEGTMTYDPAAGVYRASIGHLSMWNADRAAERTCVCGTTTDRSGAPLGGVIMSAEGVDYLGIYDDVSGNDGRFCMVVRKSSTIRVGPYPFGLGGQVRQIASGDVDTDMPPANDGAHCLDVGAWPIDETAYFPPAGSGNPVGGGCSLVTNPLSGTCADGMGDFASCWDASGACTLAIDGTSGGSTMTYESGATFVSHPSGDGLSGDYFASDGTLCATISVPVEGNGITFTLPDGTEITITSNPDDGSTTYVCTDGTSVTLTAQEGAALRACFDTGSSQGQCTLQGSGDLGSPCQVSTDCNESLVCCSAQGTLICLDQETCDQLAGP